MNEIDLKIKTVTVKTKIIKSRFKMIEGRPVFDIHPKAAKALGTTRKKWCKLMNK